MADDDKDSDTKRVTRSGPRPPYIGKNGPDYSCLLRELLDWVSRPEVQLLPLNRVAKILDIRREKVRELVNRGDIAASRVGQHLRVSAGELKKIVQEGLPDPKRPKRRAGQSQGQSYEWRELKRPVAARARRGSRKSGR